MLYSFLNPLYADILAFFTALIIMLACGGKFIAVMHAWQHEGQPIRECGPQSHLVSKKGTPTMGGLLILSAVIVSVLLYANLSLGATWVCLGVLTVFGAAGFYDDYIKVKKHTPDAMTARVKLLIQFAAALGIALFAVDQYQIPLKYGVIIPYFNITVNLWYFFIPFAMIVIAGASNAVNLSDGLDGLAAGLLIPPFIVLGVIALLIGFGLPDSLPYPSLSVVCAAVIGACAGFLWFNCSPAKIFMGDTGSLSLGALLGTIAVLAKQEILLAVIGFVFVIEALSVMIQVFWYKRTKKRVFLMAPIHHHFEMSGWSEWKIDIVFWLIAVICSVVTLMIVL